MSNVAQKYGGSADRANEHAITTIQDLFKIRSLVPYGVGTSPRQTSAASEIAINTSEVDNTWSGGVISISDLFKIKTIFSPFVTQGGEDKIWCQNSGCDSMSLAQATTVICQPYYVHSRVESGSCLYTSTVHHMSHFQEDGSEFNHSYYGPSSPFLSTIASDDNTLGWPSPGIQEQSSSQHGGFVDEGQISCDSSVINLALQLANLGPLSQVTTPYEGVGTKIKRWEFKGSKVRKPIGNSFPSCSSSSKKNTINIRGKEIPKGSKKFATKHSWGNNPQHIQFDRHNSSYQKGFEKAHDVGSHSKQKGKYFKRALVELPSPSSYVGAHQKSQSISSSSSSSGRAGRKKKSECVFCKTNGETAAMYRSHVLKDDFGQTVCHVLQQYRCPCCGATGKDAHTLKYCPKNRKPSLLATMSTLKTMRLSTGKWRKGSAGLGQRFSMSEAP